MVIFFTDNAERDADLQRELHETRTLHQVVEIHEQGLRHAIILAAAYHGHIVMAGPYTMAMRKLEFALHLIGCTATKARTYLDSLNVPAAAHAASPTQHVAAAGQNINHHARTASF